MSISKLVAVGLSLLVAAISFAAKERPNFIFILTDDQSYGMMGCDGNTIVQTPNIDRLAKDGVYFDNAHITSAICTPSRISILLSQFERKHGVNFNSGTSVSPEAWDQSYPMVMRRNGYYTGYVGKNHAPIGEGGYASGLMDKSFDYWYAGHGHIRFYPKRIHKIFRQAKLDTQIEIIQESADDFLSNEHRLEGALRFLDKRPEGQPFCLSICLNLPHGAGVGSMEQLATDDEIYRTLYRDKDIPMPKHYVAKKDIKEPRLPEDVLRADERQSGYNYVDTPETNQERIIRQMQAMTGIDRLVGNLRKKLKEEDLDENTILVFSSDHGLFMGEHGLGGKALCYETTTHVPFIVYNPMLPASKRGKRMDSLVQSIDIAPTLLDYAGIDVPKAFQGKSIRDVLEGKADDVRDYVFTENLWSTQFGNPRIEAVQNREWKYIRYYKNENLRASYKVSAAKMLGMNINHMLYANHDTDIALYRYFVEASLEGEEPVYEELYHLASDPDELNNLAYDDQHFKTLKKLKKVWKAKIAYARGTEDPKVLRYTKDGELEAGRSTKTH